MTTTTEPELVDDHESVEGELQVDTESERVGNAHEVMARYIAGYSVHDMAQSGVDDGGLYIQFRTDGAGLTADLLNLYNTLEDHEPQLMYDMGKVELMLVGSYEGHRVRFFSIARDEACDALRGLFPSLGPDFQPVEIEALWAFVEAQEKGES